VAVNVGGRQLALIRDRDRADLARVDIVDQLAHSQFFGVGAVVAYTEHYRRNGRDNEDVHKHVPRTIIHFLASSPHTNVYGAWFCARCNYNLARRFLIETPTGIIQESITKDQDKNVWAD